MCFYVSNGITDQKKKPKPHKKEKAREIVWVIQWIYNQREYFKCCPDVIICHIMYLNSSSNCIDNATNF